LSAAQGTAGGGAKGASAKFGHPVADLVRSLIDRFVNLGFGNPLLLFMLLDGGERTLHVCQGTPPCVLGRDHAGLEGRKIDVLILLERLAEQVLDRATLVAGHLTYADSAGSDLVDGSILSRAAVACQAKKILPFAPMPSRNRQLSRVVLDNCPSKIGE
jgi:hypothetical protein